jgi:hypothetical protein
MEYNFKQNGDPIEQHYAEFVNNYFPTYEQVWKIYIGNKGNDIRSEIKDYPPEREEQRKKFSEDSYTILLSVLCLIGSY